MPGKPKQKFSFLFEGDIWKIVFDSQLPLLAVETRDSISKSIFLSVLDDKGTPLILLKTIHNSWWSTISGMSQGKVAVQFFKDGKFPDPRGFLIYDINSQSVILEEKEGASSFFSKGFLISTRLLFETITFLKYKPESGEREEIKPEEFKALVPDQLNISFPLQYSDSNPHFNTVERFIKRTINKEAVKVVDYIELNSIIAVSYYIRAAEKLHNYLLITDKEGRAQEDILIGAELEGVTKDPFFVKDNRLYFVKNKKELHCYEC